MKFTVSSAGLLKSLTTVSGAVPTRSTLPILECILFERIDDQLRLSATDLEISIVQSIAVQFETNGSSATARIAIPAKRLLDTLRALPDQPVELACDSSFNVTTRTDNGVFKMVGYDGADYPAIPEMSGEITISTAGPLLKRAIAKTHFAVSRDALRPAMMGIYFQIQGSRGKAVATDGHRLVKFTLDEMKSRQAVNFIVPEKAMVIAGRIADEAPCTMTVDKGYVGFDFSHSRVIARQIDETYPNYEAVIPADNDRKLTISRDDMLAAVKRVGLYSSSMTNQVKLALKEGEVEISAEDIERSSEAHETVTADYEGEEMEIGFNAQYLTEVLNNVDSESVQFEFSSPNRAGVVTPLDQPDGEEILMLIMPVMLNTYA